MKLYSILSTLAILILLVAYFAKKPQIKQVTKVRTERVEVLKTDTLRVTDTLYQKEVVYLEKVVHSAPDTVYIENEMILSKYEGGASDSTLRISYTATVLGDLQDMQLSYQLKKPTTIIETVTITEQVEKEVFKGGFFLGVGATYQGGKTSPTVLTGYATQRGMYYGYGYAPTTKTHTVQVLRRLF